MGAVTVAIWVGVFPDSLKKQPLGLLITFVAWPAMFILAIVAAIKVGSRIKG
jgi:hypothetical protein